MSRRWNADTFKLIERLKAADWKYTEIATYLGVTASTLYQQRRRYRNGIYKRRRERMAERMAEIEKLLAVPGATMQGIGRQLGISRKAIHQFLQRRGFDKETLRELQGIPETAGPPKLQCPVCRGSFSISTISAHYQRHQKRASLMSGKKTDVRIHSEPF